MKNIITVIGSCLLVLWSGFSLVQAQSPGPPAISVSLQLGQATSPNTYQGLPVFYPGDKIPFTLTLMNTSGQVITSKGFSDQEFRLLLVFTDPKGNVITTDKFQESNTPPSSRVFVGDDKGTLISGDPVEFIPPVGQPDGNPWGGTYVLDDARTLYPLTGTLLSPVRGGIYSVKAVIPMRTYLESNLKQSGSDQYAPIDQPPLWSGALVSNTVRFTLVRDFDRDGYYYPLPSGTHLNQVDCDDENPNVHPGALEIMGNGIDDDCNPATPDVLPVVTGTLNIRAEKHTVGSGSKPGSTKEPLENLWVRAYPTGAGACADKFGTSWQNYKSIWVSCTPTPNAVGMTNAAGIAGFSLVPGNYIAIGLFDPTPGVSGNPSYSGDEIYMGVSTGAITAKQTKEKYLQLIVKDNGKKVPAKYTVQTGSELIIIEPEYIEWDGAQESYPFIFQSVGDWSVNTSVSPPEGFVANFKSLSTEVNNDLRTLQFTITDLGSKWVGTEVEHRVKHKGRNVTVRSKVGVKLSERLARQKGLGRFGHENHLTKNK